MSDAPIGSTTNPILPGSTLGVFGGGQLGRMFVEAAHQLGYKAHVFALRAGSPAGLLADHEHVGDFDDLESIQEFARRVDAATLEFENLPTDSIRAAARHTIVRPSAEVLHITQHRVREKEFLQSAGAPVGPFAAVGSLQELQTAADGIGLPAVLKTVRLGYDGKGQQIIRSVGELESAWNTVGKEECILEGYIEFTREVSVLIALNAECECVIYGPIENHHKNHILDLSLLPAPTIHPNTPKEATRIGRLVAEKLDAIGLICVEMFEKPDGELLVNEIAPRPHNSGHLTIEGCQTSQFEQQVRALCGLPLGCADSVKPAAMANLLGDLWERSEPNWKAATLGGAYLHTYGKESPRPGRKMGHLTALADSIDQAREQVLAAREALSS